jgi:predicted RNA-binding protein (virulence factor B family)
VATTRLNRHLSHDRPVYRNSQPVNLLITGMTPLGYNAIVENVHCGLLYHDKLAAPLEIGQRLKGFVRNIRPNGKIDLSLDSAGYRRVAPLTDQIVQALERNGGQMAFDDDSTPEAIRQKFNVSKKAFKQALGKLYKARRIRFHNPGIQLLDNSSWSPGK